MNTTTTTTTAAANLAEICPESRPNEQPRYRHMGKQRFVPANDAARREVARWNAFADTWNARAVGEVLQ